MSVKKVVWLATYVLVLPWALPFFSSGAWGYDGACPALPDPVGATVTVGSVEQLFSAVNSAAPGTTILIMDGAYNLGSSDCDLWIDTPGLTLRSAGGDREAVILDDDYSGSEIITVAASNVTIT